MTPTDPLPAAQPSSHEALGLHAQWQVPAFHYLEFAPRSSDYCVVIPVLNEGERIRKQLVAMGKAHLGVDLILADGGSTDNSTDPVFLEEAGLNALLVKRGPGHLSAQLRMGFAYALTRGYKGIVTIDGNGKDGFEMIPDFVSALTAGFGFVQGSRYLEGGQAINTPLDRDLSVRLLHAPLLSLAAGFRYTDTTNGFRGFSSELLVDPRVQPFREVFDTYNLHYYLGVRAPRLGYRVSELPVSRAYPEKGKTPTKISGFAGRLHILKQLFGAATGRYNPKQVEADQ